MPESGPDCLICAEIAGPVCLMCTDFAGTDCLISAEFARQLQRSRVIRVSTLRPLLLKAQPTGALMMDTVLHVPPPTVFCCGRLRTSPEAPARATPLGGGRLVSEEQGSGSMVQGAGCRVQGSGARGRGSEFGTECRVC